VNRKEKKMNQLSAESVIEAEGAAQASNASEAAILLTAWLGTLLLSRLPQIILSELGLITPADWSPWWWVSMGTALFALTYGWQAARPCVATF